MDMGRIIRFGKASLLWNMVWTNFAALAWLRFNGHFRQIDLHCLHLSECTLCSGPRRAFQLRVALQGQYLSRRSTQQPRGSGLGEGYLLRAQPPQSCFIPLLS